jgi:hypothetical protein
MAVKRTVYEVAPEGSLWTVKRISGPGKDQNSSHFTRDIAFEIGRGVSQHHQPSQLIVRRADGSIEAELSYGRD